MSAISFSAATTFPAGPTTAATARSSVTGTRPPVSAAGLRSVGSVPPPVCASAPPPVTGPSGRATVGTLSVPPVCDSVSVSGAGASSPPGGFAAVGHSASRGAGGGRALSLSPLPPASTVVLTV